MNVNYYNSEYDEGWLPLALSDEGFYIAFSFSQHYAQSEFMKPFLK